MERLTRFFAALTRWGLGLCALLLVLAALYVSLGRELTPLVAEYRAEIEAKAQAAVDMPLQIGRLEGRWSGFAPVLLAHDVMVGEGSNALRLDQVQVVPDIWASLMARDVRIAHLEVSGLQLSAREDKDGHWALQGLPVQDDQPLDPEQLLKRMQSVQRVSLLDSQVTLQPFDQAPLTFTYVGLSLQTGATRQRLDARLTLPDGQPLALSLRTQIRASAWKDAEVQAYLSLPQSDWAKWVPARLTRQWKLTQFKAGGEFWLTWAKGTVQSAVVRLNSPQVKGSYADRKPVHIENLALTAYLQRSESGLKVLFDSLAMNIGDSRWESRLQLQQRLATDKAQEVWNLQADRLDLTPITPVAQCLGAVAGRLRQDDRTPQGHRSAAQCAGGFSSAGHDRSESQLCRQPRAGRLRRLLRRSCRTQRFRQHQRRPGAGRAAHGQQGLFLAPRPDLRQALAVHPGQCAPDLEARSARLHPDRAVYQGAGRGRQGRRRLPDSPAFRQ
jgi:uncharacterized protein YhdP